MNKYEHAAELPPIAAAHVVFARQKAFAEHCAGQLDDTQLFRRLYPGLNSVGVVMQHVAGNMLSRWTDFLTCDGEKPGRNREREFAPPSGDLGAARKRIEAVWAEGWSVLFETLSEAETVPSDRVVYIRGVAHSIPMAITRQVDHYGFHVGQIATIARGLVGTDRWDWFTVPPGGSEQFNRSLGYGVTDRH